LQVASVGVAVCDRAVGFDMDADADRIGVGVRGGAASRPVGHIRREALSVPMIGSRAPAPSADRC